MNAFLGPGYELGPDGRSCVDVDECEFLNGGCDQVPHVQISR